MDIKTYKIQYPENIELNPKTSADILIEQDNVSKITTFDNLVNNYNKKLETLPTSAALTLLPNRTYKFVNLQSIQINLDGYFNNDGILREYHLLFSTNGIPPVITWPGALIWSYNNIPVFLANKNYEISIINNMGVYAEF